MKKISLYNTLNRKKEEFKPLRPNELSVYYCGPTVYWTQHIGNLRGAFCTDVITRTFEYLGYKVNLVRNYTDVGHLSSDADEGEDRMEKGAKRENLQPEQIAQKYIDIFENDSKELNIKQPSHKPKATEHINDMIELVSELIEKGFAYVTDLAVYFDVSLVTEYNKLSKQVVEKNISGAGSGAVRDDMKKNPEDFALWFFKAGTHKNAIQFWPSPFKSTLVEDGEGFPGWHIECSAMSRHFLGKTIDIHMGGIEHIPVHHTNEIAQSEAANGCVFANYWLHNEHLLVNNGKMSKSEGTSYSLSEIKEKGYKPLALRYFFLQANYRSKQNFTWDALSASTKGYDRLRASVELIRKNVEGKAGTISKEFKEKFESALADDFNTPMALAVVQGVLKADMEDKDKLATLLDFDRILGLDLGKEIKADNQAVPDHVAGLFTDYKNARENKNYELSDKIRSKLTGLGYSVEDGKDGSLLTKNNTI